MGLIFWAPSPLTYRVCLIPVLPEEELKKASSLEGVMERERERVQRTTTWMVPLHRSSGIDL